MVKFGTKIVNEQEIKANVVFTMRMLPDLYEQIKNSAIKNKRSIAKEIEFGIEQYLQNTK